MPPRTLATLASLLASARDADAALLILQQEVAEIDRAVQLALFLCDSRRQLIMERLTPEGNVVGRTPLNVAVDHLPAPVRRALNSGSALADFGAESDDYLKLLGVTTPQGGGVLSVRGLTLDGELAGFIAVYEPRRRFGNRVVDRLTPAMELFALAFERIAEHDARFEAVRTLEELTRNIHSEYNRALRGLKAELDQARALIGEPGAQEAARIAELERAISNASQEIETRSERLAAVEDQVARAVARLEQAHVELHSQTELARSQANKLYSIERLLADGDASDPAAILDKLRAALDTPA
ncbi:MAG TPA: hypothetical protein VIF83_04155 [Gemmatimonadaceae bacterium]|jgi:hypothetical protein